MKVAVIDSSPLRNLYRLGLLQHLNLLYSTVWVPREVEREFFAIKMEAERTRRFDFLEKFKEVHQSWFKACQSYSLVDIELFKAEYASSSHKLDMGEIEAIVQQKLLPGSSVDVLIDEKAASRFSRSLSIPKHGTLYILANLDLRYGLCNYPKEVEKLIEDGQRFNENVAKTVYDFVRVELL
jgi:predicted nucleic acid-binding protein